jgi:TPR repeat protein
MSDQSSQTVDAIVASAQRNEADGDWATAEQEYRQAEELGSAEGAYRLGLLLYNKGLISACVPVLQRALERGHPDAASALTAPFSDPEVSDSLPDVQRGDEAGRGVSSFALGTICEERGDIEGAKAAYRRAIDRGHVAASTNLGLLPFNSGEVGPAKEALRAAEAGGDELATEKLRQIAEMGF